MTGHARHLLLPSDVLVYKVRAVRMPVLVDNWQAVKLHVLEEETAAWDPCFPISTLCLVQQAHRQLPWGIQLCIQMAFCGARFGRWKRDKGHLVAVGAMKLVSSQVSWWEWRRQRGAEHWTANGERWPWIQSANGYPSIWPPRTFGCPSVI